MSAPPFQTRTSVARHRPTPSSAPIATPQARALMRTRTLAAWRGSCSSTGGIVIGSDLVEEAAVGLELGARAHHEARQAGDHVAAEGEHPAGDEADREAPAQADEGALQRDLVAAEVLGEQRERIGL